MINNNFKYIYVFQALYIIYMYNYFKTKVTFHHPLEIFIQKNNKLNFLKHPIYTTAYNNKICPLGNVSGFLLAAWIIYLHFYPNKLNKQINKIIWTIVTITAFVLNINAFIYLIPCLIIELTKTIQ